MAESQRMRELERLLQQAELRAQEAERGLQEVQRQRQEDQALTQPTTLNEYLTACHDSLFSNFRIEPDKSLQSKGSISSPRHKWCPTTLKPWSDFLDGQRRVFGLLLDTFPANTRAFESQAVLAGFGKRLSRRTIADEKGLESFLHISVEDPVRAIIDELKHIDEVKSTFRLGDGIVFENHPHAISDVSEEVLLLEDDVPSTPGQSIDINQLRPDQICVYRSDDSASARRTMAYVSEYKPPHKLKAPYLRLALRGSLDIYAGVVNRKTIPRRENLDEYAQYSAEKLTASAITQTYHYMIEGGLDYGLLTTGEIIVFLKIDWDEPSTLLYHLAEPSAETIAHPAHSHLCSAVGQYLAFSLVALGSSVHGQEERQRARASLKTCTSDMTFSPVDYAGIDRSPYVLRRRRRPTPDGPTREQIERGPREPPDDDSDPGFPDTPSPQERRSSGGTRRSRRIQAQRSRGGGSKQGSTGPQYCTQKCLLGLFRDLLWKQLQHSLDDGITPLAQGGARGVLLRVTLLAHGYTFVAKGTVRAFIKCLEHEAAVYERLQPSQGVYVPVYLGSIDLRSMNKIYYFDHRVYVIHMTFMSWGGHGIHLADLTDTAEQHLREKALQSLRAIHAAGVVHQDVRVANMLSNAETNGVMIIDFERASIRRPLAQVVPSKRNRKPESTDANTSKLSDKSNKRSRVRTVTAGEIHTVEMMFRYRYSD
ncbi:kinase [Hirsutella rhossiliensis]|uniref:Kinase n=1 Tax=Hirsutella rhossiliensis TaxID=111463 RepID=A0A9P8SLD6_9HYPO|nr:kinase [Hirsutella rhossiliensis]KAH0967368.1 kinase [Hirsutella rhossiliensis]